MSLSIGIEKLRLFPGGLCLRIEDLCRARGLDPLVTMDSFLVDERTVLAPWEDTVTMAVNAAAPMLTEDDRAAIGLLIVGTETAVDMEKPVSSWVHGLLGLPSDCRNFELKHACYGATAATSVAQAWLASPLSRGRKALVISADSSQLSIGQRYEPVVGAGACALLLSGSPRLLEYELGCSGVYAHDVTDVIRPTSRLEVGNGEESLVSYLEAATETYAAYLALCPEAGDFDGYFAKNLYHVPFGEITYRAHRALLGQYSSVPRASARAHFERKVLPSLTFNRRMGGTYGASTYIAMLGLCEAATDLNAGDRLGVFAYGTGSCAEFYSARLSATFREVAREADAKALIEARHVLSVSEYERCERLREDGIGVSDCVPDRRALGDVFETHYASRGRLVLRCITNYRREYVWS